MFLTIYILSILIFIIAARVYIRKVGQVTLGELLLWMFIAILPFVNTFAGFILLSFLWHESDYKNLVVWKKDPVGRRRRF